MVSLAVLGLRRLISSCANHGMSTNIPTTQDGKVVSSKKMRLMKQLSDSVVEGSERSVYLEEGKT